MLCLGFAILQDTLLQAYHPQVAEIQGGLLCHPDLWLVSLFHLPWTGAVPRALEEKDGLGFLPGVLGFDLLV